MILSTWFRSTVFALIVLGTTAGCTTESVPPQMPPQLNDEFSGYDLSARAVEQVEADVLAHLGAGEGLFSGLKAASDKTGVVVVCGWVRQRDYAFSYRRYPLNRPFAVQYRLRGPVLGEFRMVHFADEKSEAPRLYSYCARYGLSL